MSSLTDISVPYTTPVTATNSDPLLGMTLDGRYQVIEPIGQGAMGKVYRALQIALNRIVAVKVLDLNYGPGRDDAFRQRFLVEAALTARLRHPNTVTVIDYGNTPQGYCYIAMEYLKGQSLAAVLAEFGALPWRRSLNIAQQVARSLREAHGLGVVHRDLKPANTILLDADSDADLVKVLDFGLVKSFVRGHDLTERAVTEQGMLVGSPPYMAPEQGEHNRSDPRSDIYSLGILMYESLTGHPPFMGKNPLEIIMKHVREPVPALVAPSHLPPIPEGVVALVNKCLTKSPMDRFQTMDDVLAAMTELGAPQTTPVDGIPVAERAERLVRRALPAAFFLGALALGMWGVSIWSKARPTAVATVPAVTLAPAPTLPSAPAAMPSNAVFKIASNPSGAAVFLEGKKLGMTPLDVEVAPDADGRSVASLRLVAPGFEQVNVTATATSALVELNYALMPKVAAPTKAPSAKVAATRSPATKHVPPKKSTPSRLRDDDEPNARGELKRPRPTP